MAQSILQACKVVTVMMLIIGMLAYAWLLFKAFFLGDVATRQMLEGSPGHSFGLPFAAVDAFGIVSLLELTATDKTLNQSTRHWYSTKHCERAQTVRSERSRASGNVEERDYSWLRAFDCAALRSGRTERVATRSEEVYEASVV